MTGDGYKNAAVLILHDPGGSGSFYYVAVALNVNQHFQGTNAVLLDDRIVPNEIKIGSGSVEVKFVDRHPKESMSTTPSITKSVVLILNNSILEAVVPKHDEEWILGVDWKWEQTLYNNDQKAAPKDSSHYTITFNPDKYQAG